MVELHQLVLFVIASWLLNLTPGPDVLYIVRHAAQQGMRAGLVAAAGISSGCLVHVAAAAIGVSALLAASAAAFAALKWVGAAYLLWTGIQLLRAQPGSLAWGPKPEPTAVPSRLRKVYWGGFATNVLNPKVAIFFLAFIPQFIAPAYPHKSLAFAALGLLFTVNALPIIGLWALMGAQLSRRARWLQSHMHWLDRTAGAMFVGFGLKLALADRPGH